MVTDYMKSVMYDIPDWITQSKLINLFESIFFSNIRWEGEGKKKKNGKFPLSFLLKYFVSSSRAISNG